VSPSSSACSPLSESEQIEQLKKQLQWAELKIQVLEERLRLELIAKYGPASEKLNDTQLELLQLEPGVSSMEVQAESERYQSLLYATGGHSPNTLDVSNFLQTYRGGRKSWPARRNSAPAGRVGRKRQ